MRQIQKPIVTKTLAIVFLASFIMSVLPLPFVEAATPSLTLKWTGYIAGGGEALLTADVISDIPGEEVFHAGGAVAPNSGGRVTCLNGRTGAQIWIRTIANVGDTCQPTMVDVDNDGNLEIVVPLQQPAGVYILHAENGNTMYSNTAIGGGRIDSSPVAGDVDGDGYPDVFIGVMGYEEPSPSTGSTGRLIRYEWDSATSSVVERDRVTVWHPCAGGLSLGDTDNDGRWELYMNERHVYFGDGSWGRGITSFWADTLDVRWQVYDWGASSNIPMLADVDHDGVVDVVTTDLSAGVCVLNSSTGRPLIGANGAVLSQTRIAGRHNHYQSSIYDIDADGALEVLSGDGFEGEFDFVTVFDLYHWTLDASIDTTIAGGRSWKGPTVGEVSGDGRMDIIVTTFDHINNADAGTVQVYDRNYNLIYLNTGLRHRAIESVVQDVDRNDGGLNELLILTQGGVVYCFETPGIASNPRARSEIQFYSESRLGASEYVPLDRPYPDVSSPSPAQRAVGVSTGTSLTFRLNHPLGQTMSYTVTTSPNIGSGSGTNVGNGLRTVTVGGLLSSTTYSWRVSVTDQSGHATVKTYTFTTGPYTPNSAPTQTQPSITGSTILDNIIASNRTTTDTDGDEVTNIYNWLKNGVSVANLNLPFETQTDPQAEYSGLATTKDYAYGATANVFGATWVADGVVGGAYLFDGNDFIRIPQLSTTSTRYDGNGAWTEMSVELWVKANTMSSAERLILKTNYYDGNTSYRLDCSRTSTSLAFTWLVGTGTLSNPVTYTLGPYSVTTGVGDWHHVVVTYKSGVGLRLYINGVQVSNLLGPTYTGNILNTDGPFEIAFGSGSDFKGLVDEVRLYPYEISAFMVNQRYLDAKDSQSSHSTISKYDTNIGDQWLCQVTPNDGLIDGTTINTAARTVVDAPNEAPSASNLVITPASPLTGDDLVASYTYTDPEGNPEAGSIVSWYKGGVFVFSNPTLPASLTTKGDVWNYRVTPSDGFEYGTQKSSGTVTIGNTAPSFTDGVILPNPAFDSSTLTASPSGWVDTDNDTAGYTYQWQRKVAGVYQNINGATSPTLSTAYFSPNDWIRVQVTAYDGLLYGNTLALETQIIDSDPPSTGTPQLVSSSGSNRDDDELTCTPANTQDPDGDSVINIYNWLRGGTSITNLYLPFETNSITSVTDYSGYNNNGALTGATWTSQGIIGGAISFDGNDFIAITDSASLGNDGTWTAITVEYWVNPSIAQKGGRILNKNGGTASTSGKYMTGFNSGSSASYNVVFFGVTTADTYGESAYQDTSSNTATAIPTGTWTHVVGTYKAGEGIKLYINGVLASQLVGVAGNIETSIGEPLIVGYSSPIAGTANRYFSGKLDEIHIYPTALSAQQVFQNYIDQKDGVGDKVTIVPLETSSGQTWRCRVTPNDGWQDGTAGLSNQITITSTNTKPHIDWYSPSESVFNINVGESVDFKQISSDPNGSPLTYRWTLDSVQQATTQNWTYTPLSASQHTIRVTVSDGSLTDYQEWVVNAVLPFETYTLTINKVGQGSVNLNPAGGNYMEGTEVALTATPSAGYTFTGWSGSLTSSNNPETLTMDGDKTVTATFTQDEHTLTITLVGSGSVNKSPLQATYHYGDVVTLTATPSSGWWFFDWSGDATGITNPKQITITGDMSVTATFSDQNILTVNIVGSGDVTLNPLGGLYADGTVVELTATADLGWTFTGWTGDMSGSDNPKSITMDSHKTVTATFTQNHYTLTVNVVGTDCSVTRVPNLATYSYGTKVNLTAFEALGWTFSEWSGDVSGTELKKSVTMDGDKTVTATFTQDEYTLTVNTIGSGSVDKQPDQATYHYGDSVTLTASAADGWVFHGWSGGLSGSDNPETILMNGDKMVTASFTQPSAHLFEDGFEAGNFALWNGQDTGASISAVNPLEGTYHLRSSLASGANNLWRGIYKSISGTNPVYLGAFVDFNAPPNTDNEDQWVLCFSQSTAGNALAYAGLRRVSGTNYWAIWYLSAGTTLTYQVSGIAFVDGWHDLELAIYRGTPNNGWVEFRVDGVLVCSAHNLSNSGRTLSYARVGFSYSDAQSAASSTVDIDNVTIDSDVAPPTLYNVNMLSSGASTNNLGSMTFDGTNYALPSSISRATGSYSLSFTPALGYVFDHWATTGSVSVANPNTQSTTITFGGAGSLEAVYSLAPIPEHLFADGFESSSFIAWSGTSITTGSSATVGSAMPHSGTYSAQFSVTSGSSTSARRAYSSVSGLSLAELNASAYVYIADGLPLTSGQNMWLIQFIDSSGNALASFGMRADASGTHWAVQSGNYPYAMAASTVPAPSEGQWYLLEAYYTHAATGKTLILSVNGVEVVSMAQNTSAANNVATVRVGIDYYVTSTSAMIYVDDVTIDN